MQLRGIEVMLQVHEEKGEESDPQELIHRIYKVLYAKQDDDIFVSDEGELIENGNNEDKNNVDVDVDAYDGGNNDSLLTMDDE